ncbi:MAG: discoidin domain-containing protein [Sphingobium sp.]|nr:discoidin domain-containing protein [Sphingobium sp.]
MVIVDLSDTAHQPAFRPDEALGAGIDGAQQGDIGRLLTAHNIAAMRSAGLRPLTYRLRTELGIQVWHWNPVGRWSDPARKQGYWISSDRLGPPIKLSWGYNLPRRGDTVDNANNVDYSRLTDGDKATFWKSNPYLDPTVLHDGETHPQWLIVRLNGAKPIDAAQIDWAEPYATHFEVQYWTGQTDYDGNGRWVTFPHGRVTQGKGGQSAIRLAETPVTTQWIRVLLESASGTAPAGSKDWRDRAGFAVREVAFGRERTDGSLDDAVVHAASHDGQTWAHVSSTDPWHRAIDRDKDLEQVGIDRIFANGLGNGLPIMMPTGLLFDTPENVEAELRYLMRRRYPMTRVELGEEPDGQYGVPADYGALYLSVLDRLKPIAPKIQFGGPSLQSAYSETTMLPETPGSWNRWFADYLKRRKRLHDIAFLSFEFYPFDDICGDIHAKLVEQDGMLREVMNRFAQDGFPAKTPKIISEYGFSAYSGRAMSEMPSALLMANIVGRWLSLGGETAYMFGYGPNVPSNQHEPCAGFGNMMLHQADENGQADKPMPSYFTARLLTNAWTVPGHGLHRLARTSIEGVPQAKVAAFSVVRPDHRLAVMLINRSPDQAYRFAIRTKAGTPIKGPAQVYGYGPAQYAWADLGAKSHPLRTEPPEHHATQAGPVELVVPADSIVVAVMPPG